MQDEGEAVRDFPYDLAIISLKLLITNLSEELPLNIQNQFNLIAEQYDRNRRRFIPCFDDFYANTTKFIASNINTPKRVIDLGAGTGILTYFWYQQFPHSQFILVDIADEMLNIARERFRTIDNVSYLIENYKEKIPDVLFDTVISALSIHHLEHQDKTSLFTSIYERLPDNGLFINNGRRSQLII